MTTTSLISSAVSSVFDQAVTFTASVANVAPGVETPTGQVIFYDGSTPLTTATLAGGSASFSTSTLSIADHVITALYLGDTDHQSSRSSGQSGGQR